jgi:hypothetical protein
MNILTTPSVPALRMGTSGHKLAVDDAKEWRDGLVLFIEVS